jgi:hypothetical protein
MAALLETEKPKTETKLNVPLLRAALLSIEADPHGFDMTGFAVASVITAHSFPVNLKEHLAFVLGLNYLRLGEFDIDIRVSRALRISLDRYYGLVEMRRWPEEFRELYLDSGFAQDEMLERVNVTRLRVGHFITHGL